MRSEATIRLLRSIDTEPIGRAFEEGGMEDTSGYFERLLLEQEEGRRVVLVATLGGRFAGCVTVDWRATYPPFRGAGIPEIQDLVVLPGCRRRGVGAALLAEAERLAAERADEVGLGVGLTADYGAAQRLYAQSGYLPDGRGVSRAGRTVQPGELVPVDDSLVLHLTKRLG